MKYSNVIGGMFFTLAEGGRTIRFSFTVEGTVVIQ